MLKKATWNYCRCWFQNNGGHIQSRELPLFGNVKIDNLHGLEHYVSNSPIQHPISFGHP